ncbi:MAG: FAD-dependent oxidoreductase [Verrucomicrobia bacterium]|nr:FAD-dependent oxidoreductase [Verrucomicrobiota bacterium]
MAFDSGFMVYNEVTYPRLTALFSKLKVPVMNTDMSFGVQHVPDRLEFCGSNLNTLFAQRRNLFRTDFWRMLLDVMRFNKEANQYLDAGAAPQPLHDFLVSGGYGAAFMENYLLPMTSAIWSTPPDDMLKFPAQALLNFMRNHGLLGVSTHHQWKTVRGGSAQYRDRLIAPFRDSFRIACPVVAVVPRTHGVTVRDAAGKEHNFDKVVIAAHADEALELLPNPSHLQRELLGSFQYSRNLITVHTDSSVMPRNRRAWASWNYRMDRGSHGSILSSTHYWMNNLQGLTSQHPYFVSVNAGALVDSSRILRRFNYAHPTFDSHAIAAQEKLPQLNDGKDSIFFCGSYFRYGFHEDALMAGMQAADAILQKPVSHAILPV